MRMKPITELTTEIKLKELEKSLGLRFLYKYIIWSLPYSMLNEMLDNIIGNNDITIMINGVEYVHPDKLYSKLPLTK